MIEVTLDRIELKIGRLVGEERFLVSRAAGLNRNKHGIPANGDIDISGARGEMAVAKLLDRYWFAGVNTFHKADIGNDIQVRTAKQEGYRLIIRHGDNPTHKYYLAIDRSPVFLVVGWIIGNEGMKPEYWEAPNDRPGAYFVPQDKLHDPLVWASYEAVQ